MRVKLANRTYQQIVSQFPNIKPNSNEHRYSNSPQKIIRESADLWERIYNCKKNKEKENKGFPVLHKSSFISIKKKMPICKSVTTQFFDDNENIQKPKSSRTSIELSKFIETCGYLRESKLLNTTK